MDARAHLNALVGKTIHTIGQGGPNRIVAVDGPPPVTERTADRDRRGSGGDGHARAHGGSTDRQEIVGYRSAFIGAVLATLPCVHSAAARQTQAHLSDSDQDGQRSP